MINLHCSHQNATSNAVLRLLADLSHFHVSADYIFILQICRSSIFLPPQACGFTPPQGDSRWRSSMREIITFRTFPAKHPFLLRHLGHTFSEGHYLYSSDTDMVLFHRMSSQHFFCFRTLSFHSSLSFRITVQELGFRD